MSRKRQLFLLTCLAATCTSSATCQSDTSRREHGNLTIHLSNTEGAKQLRGEIRVYSKKDVLVYSTATASDISIRLPFGEYVVTFASDFLRPIRRAVEVDSPEVFMVLATSMGPFVLDFPIDPVSVSIKVAPTDSCNSGYLWAKLVGVFSDYSKERQIGPRGFTLFEPVEIGTYVVVIVDGKLIRATQTVVASAPITVMNISLQPCSSQPK